MKKFIPLVISATLLSGCASANEYTKYADTQLALEQERAKVGAARYAAEAARYKAIATIAASGDATAKVAGVMALQNTGDQSFAQASGTPNLAKPVSGGEMALKWASILVPAATNLYGIYANQVISTTNSDNNRDVAISTNEAFVGMAGHIQSPAANVNYTVDGSQGVTIGEGTSTWSTATTTTYADSYNPVDSSNNPFDSYNNPITYPIAP